MLGEAAGRQQPDAATRLRPDQRPRQRDRADHLGAARLLRPALVRRQAERQGRHAGPARPAQIDDQAHGGGDRELLRGRQGRRLHRLRQADVPLQGGKNGCRTSSGRRRYPNSGIVKPSQVDAGSGTTPTIMRGGYVAITDNADPMNVVVYRTASTQKGEKRRVCQVPIFRPGRERDGELDHRRRAARCSSRTTTATRTRSARTPARSPSRASPASTSTRKGKGCTKVVDQHRRARSDRGPEALDEDRPDLHLHPSAGPERPRATTGRRSTARTGETVWSSRRRGLLFNNNYAGLALGPNGTAYLGVIGGIDLAARRQLAWRPWTPRWPASRSSTFRASFPGRCAR